MMTHASLFSGIGGFDLAAEEMGWNNAFHCEINPFCQRNLKYYWPNAKTYTDIKQTDFSIWRGRIDILTGGFPCQPYSSAGKRLGKEDERHLWPEMLRAIKEIQPAWIVGENVSGILTWNEGLVFEEVCADLEKEGYQVQAFIIPACAAGAPHRRDRVWIIAYSPRFGSTRKKYWHPKAKFGYEDAYKWISTYSDNINRRMRSKIKNRKKINYGCYGIYTYSNSKRLQGSKLHGSSYERNFARQSLVPTAKLYKIPHWEDFPTQSPVCGRDDGIPNKLDGITLPKWRNESIKGYGNAVVPQIVYEIFKAIQSIHP